MLRAATISAALALAGCGSSTEPAADAGADAAPHGCELPFLGDASQPPSMQVFVLGVDMTLTPVQDGDTVPLIAPPQGGRVIFAGVRAKNLDACGVVLGGAVRDETTMQVRIDKRTVNLLPTSDGWGESDPTDISTFANVPVCPNQWSKTDIYGTEYQLELSVTDRGGRTVEKKVKVVPACAEPARAAECLCTCKGGYMLGETCGDAGAPDGDAGAPDGGDGGT